MSVRVAPLGSKTSRDGQRALLNHIGPDDEVHLVHTDAAQELIQTMDELQSPGRDAVPAAVRAVRTLVEASRTALLHAGLLPCFWP